jgi:iron complex transport system substrate-binding protein
LVALTLVAAACGNDDDTEVSESVGESAEATAEPADEAAFPVEVTADNGSVAIEAEPQRIVSLSPTLTEMLFAVDAGDQVVAVDDQSDFPEDAPTTDLSGFEPNVEAVASFDPDLVTVSDDINDVVAGLERLDIPVLQLGAATSLEDTYEQIRTLGTATGNAEAADQLVEDMMADIDSLVAEVPERDTPVTYFHEIDNELFTATSSTFIGQIYALAGLENVADEADDGSGFPQVSSEFVLEADPDVIFLADATFSGGAEEVAKRPGWDELTAVQEGRIVELDPSVSSRWGPRVVDFLRVVVKETAHV